MRTIIAIAAAMIVAGRAVTLSEDQILAAMIREEIRYHVTDPCQFAIARPNREDPGSRWFGADIGVIQRAMRGPYSDRLIRESEADVIRAVWPLKEAADREKIYSLHWDMCRAAAMERIGNWADGRERCWMLW